MMNGPRKVIPGRQGRKLNKEDPERQIDDGENVHDGKKVEESKGKEIGQKDEDEFDCKYNQKVGRKNYSSEENDEYDYERDYDDETSSECDDTESDDDDSFIATKKKNQRYQQYY